MVLPRQSALLSTAQAQAAAQAEANREPTRLEQLRAKRADLERQYNARIADYESSDMLRDKVGNVREKKADVLRNIDENIKAAEKAERLNISYVEAKRQVAKEERPARIAALSSEERAAFETQRQEVRSRVIANAPEAQQRYYDPALVTAAKSNVRIFDADDAAKQRTAARKPDVSISELQTANRNRDALAQYQGVTVTASEETPKFSGVSYSENFEPNFSTAGGESVYVSPKASTTQLAPNTSTESGAVYTPPSFSQSASERTERSTGERLGSALKTAGSEIGKGFFFSDGLSSDSEGFAQRGLYRIGQGLNVIPAGATLKVVGWSVKGYKAFKAGNFYQGLNLGGRFAVGTGKFAVDTTAIVAGTTATANIYSEQQSRINLEGTGISTAEFNDIINTANENSRKDGKVNNFLYNVDTRLGSDKTEFDTSVYNQLVYDKGLTSQQATNLLPAARTTRATKGNIEIAGMVLTSARTELFGRESFGIVNKKVTDVFTKKYLRESTFKIGEEVSTSPAAVNTFSPFLTKAQAKGVSTTTKGSVLYLAGIGEGASQEAIQIKTRDTGGGFKEVATSGFYGGTSAFTLGAPILRAAEFDTTITYSSKGKPVTTGGRLGKNVNLFANVADPFEKAGDLTADASTSLLRLRYDAPVITVGGTPTTPTYSFETAPTVTPTAVTNEYFGGKNKGQATFGGDSTTNFIPTTTQKQKESPAPVPVDNKPIIPVTIPEPVVIPSAPVDTKPLTDTSKRGRQPIPLPIPVDTKPIIPVDTKPIIPVDTKPVVPVNTKPVVPVNVPVTVPVPVVTPTPKELPAAFVAVGGAFSGLGTGKKSKRLFKYTPSAYSLLTGFTGKTPSKRAVKTGFSIRPITKKGKRRKKKGDAEELIKGFRYGKRKRKRQRFGAF